jgi:putative redox protein
MEAEVAWKDGLAFIAKTETGSEITLGSHSFEIESGGFSPMELIALGLAGCTAIDVSSILQKKRQQVIDLKVHFSAERANDHPRVFTHITLEYHITGNNVDENAVLRSIGLSATKYCPVQAMLSPVVPIELKYFIYEKNSVGDNLLTKSGAYNT